MAGAVASAIEEGGTLLAEAGTGTGKTLAYLAPAILSRQRVMVSTGTKNLQEQILRKDLPLLESALGTPIRATVMKGRGNYLCLYRFDDFRRERAPRGRADRVFLTLIEEWLPGTSTGDRAEVDELPEDVPFWGEIAATTENCLGSECPRFADCFVTRMRQRALESDILIVSHHLLCADAAVRQRAFGEVIPECPILVVDEAHQLEDVATQYFGLAVSNLRVDELVRDGERVLKAQPPADRSEGAALLAALGHVARHARVLFLNLQQQRPGAAQRAGAGFGLFDERLRLTPEVLDPFADAGLALTGALEALEAAVGLVTEAGEDVRALGRRASELRRDLRVLLRADDPSLVYFLELRQRGVFLRASPIDVAGIIRELIFDRARTRVLTSATLCVNGSFEYVESRLGIRDGAELRLESEFDYGRQAILYLPRSMPDPRSPAFAARAAEEIAEILLRTDGRAFVLFTSHASLREVHARVSARVPFPAFVQGDAPRSLLLDQFKSTPNAVLFATSSFWQGVDVVGEALSCVIIDKLPFASPGDPIVQARMEAIQARGGDPFHDYQVPLAILTLLQGLGRLLRHRSDRGVLAVLDPRLRTMGYGRRFLASLPPAPVTHDVGDVERFFAGT